MFIEIIFTKRLSRYEKIYISVYFFVYILTGTDICTCSYVFLLTAEVHFKLLFKITAQEYKVIGKDTRLRYKVFMVLRINGTDFLDVTLCSLVNTYCYFEGKPCMKMET